jgi:hypothetical protein
VRKKTEKGSARTALLLAASVIIATAGKKD